MIKAFSTSLTLLFLAGTGVLLYFILLAGVRDAVPLNQLYWIQFDTAEITNANVEVPNPVRWTFYNYCAVDQESDHTVNCTSTHAAFPFTPQDAFHTSRGLPSSFIDERDTYYYLTRIAYGFYIATLFFGTCALAFTCISCCSVLGVGLVAFFSFLAFVFDAAATAMVTAAYVKAKNAFTSNGTNAQLSIKMFAFAWTTVALTLLAFLFMAFAYCCSGRKNRHALDSGAASSKGGFFSSSRKPSAAAGSIPAAGMSDDDEKPSPLLFWKKKDSPAHNYASSFERIEPPPPSAAAVQPGAGNPMAAGFFKTNRRRDNDSYYAENR